MKNMKKILALLVAVLMIVAMVPAMAAGHSSITINNAVKDHTYTAYRILAGDVANGKLSNVEWGNGITDAGKTALYTKYSLTGENQTAAKVADAIGTTDADAIAFANAIGTNVTGGTAIKATADGQIKFENLDDGYYMIVDTWTGDTSAVDGKDYTLARFMIQLAGTATVNNKADKPTVDKVIVEDSTDKKENTAQIGDTVNYKVTSKVPQYDGYKEYYMDFEDTMSKGLTFGNDVSVSIGGTTLATDAYTVTTTQAYDATNGTKFTIHLKDFVSRNYTVGADIVITYTGVINDNAVIGNEGNPNTIKLKYSNNPLHSGDGTPDNPDEDVVNGETPESTVKTFVTEIQLVKIDKADTTKKLAGAVFNVKGSTINKVLVTGDEFVADATGDYWKLKDNKGYTTKAPTDLTKDQYDSETQKYKKQAYATSSVQETANVDFEVVSGNDGIIKITGLKEGTYTFTEIQAPDGYNLLDAPITVTVSSNISTKEATAAFAWSATSEKVTVTDLGNGKFGFNVENGQGNTLPSTGGIGTTLFYIGGGILVLAAVILLVTKRRMSAND